ncbi:MAG TPA: sigma factor-like helix-turn-helix DNA-binding protein [Acidimicrobiales bacterium]
MTLGDRDAFEEFVSVSGARLRQALVARFGLEVGLEATADALGWAWEHWDRVEAMDNHLGYLFRVGQSSARRYRRWGRKVDLPPEPHGTGDWMVEPGLHDALVRLPDNQRVAVLLIKGHDWSYADVAAVLGASEIATRTHVHRGLERLRRLLGAEHD